MTPSPDPWRDVTAARLPAAHLSALAPVRHLEGVCVEVRGADAWVRWPAGRPGVARCLLSVPGSVFFIQRGAVWVRFGSLVPTSDAPPADIGIPLATALVPARFEALEPERSASPPLVLGVARGGVARPTSALACSVAALVAWADQATTAELAAVRAARSGDRVVLLGERLPAIATAVRYWGHDVFVPLGFRPEPALPDAALRAAEGASADELLLLDETGAELIPRGAFEALTRAGVRRGAALP